MYDFSEVGPAHDALWLELVEAARRRGLGLPARIDHPFTDYDAHWSSARLMFTQICGFEIPLRRFPDLRVVGRPHFETEWCSGPYYRSLVIVREDERATSIEEMRGSTLAINSPFSHSGCCSLIPLIAPLAEGAAFFGRIRETGAHVASLAAVRAKKADLAAIDCVTFSILAQHRPRAVEGVRVIETTELAPAPPYVARGSDDVRAKLAALMAELSPAPELFICGFEASTDADYDEIFEFVRTGKRRSYLELLHPLVVAQCA